MATTAASSTAPVSKLNREHAYYKSHKDWWTQYDLLYRGGPVLKNDAARFLIKAEKEMQDVYLERLKRFTYQNIAGPSIGWYQSKLFSRDPEIHMRIADGTKPYEGANQDFYTKFLQNCDRSGTTFVDLWRQVFLNVVQFKDCYICIDLPRSDSSYVSLNQQKAAGALDPYVMIYDPRNVINWQVDDYGNFEWMIIRVEQSRQQFLGDAEAVTRWYYYDRTDYRVYESRIPITDANETAAQILGPDGKMIIGPDKTMADLVDSGKHALAAQDRVPVHYVTIPDGLHLMARAFLGAISHLNLENDYLWALHRGNVPMPIYKTDSEIKPTISAAGVIQILPGDSFEWTEPKGTSYEHSQKCLNQIREEIYRQMYLSAQGRDSSASASSSSGYAKEMDMMPGRDILAAFGDIMRAAMQLCLTTVRDARGDNDLDFDVRGFNFENNPVVQAAEIGELLLSLPIQSNTWVKEMQKTVIRASMADANADMIEICIDEIDAAPTQDEIAAAQASAMKLNMDRSLNRSVTSVGSAAQQAA